MNKNYESKNIIEATGTKEIISDLEAFDSVKRVNIISVSKSEKQIWPKIEIVITDPGNIFETNGWSSHPPARSIRYGIKHDVRKSEVDLLGKFLCGILLLIIYSIPNFLHSSFFSAVFPSSFTNK